MLRNSPWRGTAAAPLCRLRSLFVFLASLVAISQGGRDAGAGEPGEAPLLSPPDLRESTIAAGEVHAFRAAVAGEPLLLTVEQRGIDLVLVDHRPGGGDPVVVDAPNRRWGPEILLLDTPGEHRIEVQSRDAWAAPGAYTLRLSGLGGDERRRAAVAAMTRAAAKPAAWTREALSRSLAAYREALAGWQALSERALEAESLSAIAWREDALGDRRPALSNLERARVLWRELGEPGREAATLDKLGLVCRDLGESERAREALAGSLATWRRLGERLEVGSTLADAGLVEQSSGALQAALALYQEARALLHELGARRDEANVLNNLGGLYDLLGEPDAALEHYREALALRRQLDDRPRVAQTLNNMAVVARGLGDWQAALEAYDQVLEILGPLHRPDLRASALNNIAYLDYVLGEPESALPLFEEALALHHAIGDRKNEANARVNLALCLRALGEADRALDQEKQALALALALEDAWLETVARLQAAEIRIDQNDAGATRDLEAAMEPLSRTGSPRLEAWALLLRGRALANAGQPEAALGALRQALERRQSTRDRAGAAQVLDQLATVERGLGSYDEARAHAEAAIATIEELRSGLVSLELRATFLANHHRTYSFLIDLLMDRHRSQPAGGFDRLALEVSERARARSLLDLIYEGSDGSRRQAGPPELAARRRELARRLSAKAALRDGLAARGPARDEAALDGEIDALLLEIAGLDSESRRQAPGEGGGDDRPLGAEAIAALLEPGTVLLEVALGEPRSYLWTVSRQGIRSSVLPGERELERRARQLYGTLAGVEPGARDASAAALGRILLQPAWAEVAHAERLVVVPDAALDLIPWGVLGVPPPGQSWSTDGRVPLIELKEVVEVPSATTLAAERRRLAGRPEASRWAAVLADPVFAADDPRVPGARRTRHPAPPASQSPARDAAFPAHGSPADGAPGPGFARLPASRREAAAIAGLAPPGQVFEVLDFAASRQTVLSGELRPYRIVHFATHAVADTHRPELSGLVLSQVDAGGRPQAGFLRLQDLYDLDLSADLVVVSGCQTALGKELRGEGLISLTRGFAAAGVPRVVGSLWRVEDRPAAELMTRFYRAMWLRGDRPAAALRAAQREMRHDPRYRDPHFWAAFVYQGDWRQVDARRAQ